MGASHSFKASNAKTGTGIVVLTSLKIHKSSVKVDQKDPKIENNFIYLVYYILIVFSLHLFSIF